MIGKWKRFDTAKRPNRQWRILMPITWAASFPKARSHRCKIDKSGMIPPTHPSLDKPRNKKPRLKPPYFILCNHNSFMDFMILTRAIFPRRANYVVAIDGFIGMEWLLRAIGCIGNRKFTRSVSLVKNMIAAKNNGDIVVLYPEARYSLCGTTAVLPESLAKMVRKMNVPVVTFICHGHHINEPFWNLGNRKVKPIEAEMTQIITAEEIVFLSNDEIMSRIRKAFVYDDFAWQKEKGIKVKDKKRAEGLHKVLYQCPACKTEYKMESSGINVSCAHCGKTWEMTELGELKALSGDTEFSHIPDWYEWERENVRREVQDGIYKFEHEVRITSLPNTKKFRNLGMGNLIHDINGFVLTGTYKKKPFEVRWSVPEMYSCHIEYDYKGQGQCIDLNTLEDTFYVYPQGSDFAVTKVALATEELFQSATGKEG